MSILMSTLSHMNPFFRAQDDDAPPPMDGKPFIPSEEFVQEGNPYTAEATAPPAPHLLPPQYPSYGGPSPTQGPPPSLPGSHPGLPYVRNAVLIKAHV